MIPEENRKKYAEVIAKAWSDDGFKKKLLANPEEALKEMGVDIPPGKHIKVAENTPDTFWYILPEKPEGTISDEDLKKISGADGSCCNPHGCYSYPGQS